MVQWIKRHTAISFLFSLIVISLPQWLDAVWSLAEKITRLELSMPDITWANWFTVPLGLLMFAVLIWAIKTEKRVYSVVCGEVINYGVLYPNGNWTTFDGVQESDSTSLTIDIDVDFITMRKIQIESVELEIDGKSAMPMPEWQTTDFTGDNSEIMRFCISSTVARGKKLARIKAIVDSKLYLGDTITLDLPHRIRETDKGGFQKR